MPQDTKGLMRLFTVICFWLTLTASSYGAAHDEALPLHDGKLRIHDLNGVLCRELGLPSCPAGGEVDLNSPGGSDFLSAINAVLWNGCSLQAQGPVAAILHLDEGNVVSKFEAIRRISRVYAAERTPAATAAQARNWGLLWPRQIDATKPLVVLIHGLDSDRSDCMPIGDLLQQSGHQVAYFSYPGDQAIEDSALLFGRSLRATHARFPTMPIDVVAHSMGGLVAREYLEGPDYSGGVRHLIMVAPPNAGSAWARLRVLLSVQENYHLRQFDPNWNWTWMITEGMGEAGADLLPGSDFLQKLNSRPRCPGVVYTIVAGNKSSAKRVQGNIVENVSSWIPKHARTLWGFRNCYASLTKSADRLHNETGASDGPVTLESARLPGVTDYVILPADHVSLYLPVDGHPPAAWPVIQDRLN